MFGNFSFEQYKIGSASLQVADDTDDNQPTTYNLRTNISITEENMLLLATALRLWSVVQREAGEDRVFVKLHWVEAINLYLAEYHDYNEEHTEHDTYYMVYSVSSAGTICNETLT